MVFCLLKLFQHFLFVVLFRLLSLGEERANLDKIVEDLRLEAEFHLVVKLSLNLNCRTLVRLKRACIISGVDISSSLLFLSNKTVEEKSSRIFVILKAFIVFGFIFCVWIVFFLGRRAELAESELICIGERESMFEEDRWFRGIRELIFSFHYK